MDTAMLLAKPLYRRRNKPRQPLSTQKPQQPRDQARHRRHATQQAQAHGLGVLQTMLGQPGCHLQHQGGQCCRLEKPRGVSNRTAALRRQQRDPRHAKKSGPNARTQRRRRNLRIQDHRTAQNDRQTGSRAVQGGQSGFADGDVGAGWRAWVSDMGARRLQCCSDGWSGVKLRRALGRR